MAVENIGHILDRAIIHFYAGGGLMISILIALEWARRKLAWFPRPRAYMFYILPCLLCLMWIGMYEAGNVANGQSLFKAWSDFFSWMAGVSLSCWGLHRLAPATWRTKWEIDEHGNRLT
jgi:hypothetical protein